MSSTLLVTIPELSGRILSHVRYLMKNKAEGPAGYGRTESQVGLNVRSRVSPSSKGEWHLPHVNEADPLPGGGVSADTDKSG